MNPIVTGIEISVRGSLFRTARLRHEWCDSLANPAEAVAELGATRAADLFTFVTEIGDDGTALPYHREPFAIAALPVGTYEAWWDAIGKKKRNQIRKAQKSGVELRVVALDRAFAEGVESIYNESPVRQGRRFVHYGQKAPEVEAELGSFIDRSLLVGAYCDGRLSGFVKLFRAERVLRIIHILARLEDRDKCVMDALVGKAVELCVQHSAAYLQYGTWTDSGVGQFRMKHGFQRVEVPRYFVPLNWRGRLMLDLKLHRPLRERVPDAVLEPLLRLRAKWNALRFSGPKEFADA